MRTIIATGVAVGVAAATALAGAPAAHAAAPASALPAEVLPASVQFGGFGTAATAEQALDNALADARAQAAAAGYTDGEVAGDPIIQGLVRPGFPVSYLALVTIGCTQT